jgi:hypothetical protein
MRPRVGFVETRIVCDCFGVMGLEAALRHVLDRWI